jgi:hypothetical protein
MKKIPTLFERVFEGHKKVDILPNITPGCEEAFINGDATIKIDGSCCAIIDGAFFKRYDCKKGKTPPEGAIPCCDPDPITGHWPHWVKVSMNDPADKWFVAAYKKASSMLAMDNYNIFDKLSDGTYEAVGFHFQGNPYKLDSDVLVKHGTGIIDNLDRTFDGVKSYLEEHEIEGIVFWLNGEPVCKIKRSDFGLPWPVKEGE